MQLVGNKWDEILEEEYHKDYFKKIVLYINKAYKEKTNLSTQKLYIKSTIIN